ncbi:MAG: TonB-dependent receptor, partial [Kordiimonas sp.]
MKRQTLGFKLLSSTVLASSLVSAGAMAQSADTFELEEILVTATKRGAKSVQDVPIAIQALNGSDLKAAGATEFIDIAGKVPSLQFEDLGPGDKKYIIRGVNSSGASTVGVYYDEGILTASNAEDGGGRNADIRLYDLERVEVLKGPQGTLYGASSMSGTIRFVTNKPKGDLVEGYISGELSHTKKGGANYNVNGMINLPIVENKLAMRTVAWLEDQSGFIDANRIPSGAIEDINTNETYGLRTHLRMWASDALTLTASGTYQKTDSDGSSRYTPAGTMSFGDADNGFAPVPGGDLVNTDLTQSLWKEDLYTLGMTAEYVGDAGSLTATTNYYKRNIDFAFDSSPILFFFGVPIPGITLQPQERSIWSSELRYASSLDGPFNFVVGGFYGEEKQDFEVQVIATDDD